VHCEKWDVCHCGDVPFYIVGRKNMEKKSGKTTRGSVKSKGRKTEKPEKSTYERVISGEIEPHGAQKGWSNLQPEKYNFSVIDKEKHREISRKGAQAVNKLHGEKKSARESLEKILTLRITDEIMEGADVPPEIAERLKRDNPNATLYDLIHIVAVGRAVGGSIPAMQYIRDTHGDKPIERMEVTENVTTDSDRELMRQIARRLETAETVQIVANITPDNVKTQETDDGNGAKIT